MSILNYELANHFAYLRVLQFLSHRGEAYYPNQSVNGLLNRWYGHTDSLVWDIHRYPSLPAKIYAVTIVISAILILLAFVVRPRAKSTEESLLDFIRAALAFTMASPIAWEHHYGILPPLLVTLMFFGLRMSAGTGRKAYLSVLGGAYITSASYFAFANHFAGSRLNFLQSYLFFAALALLVLAYVPELKRFRLSGQGQEDGSYKPHEVSHAAV